MGKCFEYRVMMFEELKFDLDGIGMLGKVFCCIFGVELNCFNEMIEGKVNILIWVFVMF